MGWPETQTLYGEQTRFESYRQMAASLVWVMGVLRALDALPSVTVICCSFAEWFDKWKAGKEKRMQQFISSLCVWFEPVKPINPLFTGLEMLYWDWT